MKKIPWGILGTGAIARKFASDLSLIKDAELIAVGSRSKESAEAFSTLFPVLYCHASYEDLARNPEVDVIYIATPHSCHHEHTLLCLGHGKAVLCEKPFARSTRHTGYGDDPRCPRKERLSDGGDVDPLPSAFY